jgi:hypothetical protein
VRRLAILWRKLRQNLASTLGSWSQPILDATRPEDSEGHAPDKSSLASVDVELDKGPPPHWIARVRQKAPHLLNEFALAPDARRREGTGPKGARRAAEPSRSAATRSSEQRRRDGEKPVAPEPGPLRAESDQRPDSLSQWAGSRRLVSSAVQRLGEAISRAGVFGMTGPAVGGSVSPDKPPRSADEVSRRKAPLWKKPRIRARLPEPEYSESTTADARHPIPFPSVTIESAPHRRPEMPGRHRSSSDPTPRIRTEKPALADECPSGPAGTRDVFVHSFEAGRPVPSGTREAAAAGRAPKQPAEATSSRERWNVAATPLLLSSADLDNRWPDLPDRPPLQNPEEPTAAFHKLERLARLTREQEGSPWNV